MKTLRYFSLLLFLSFSAHAHEGMNPQADYGFGLTGGFLTGTGFYLRKYLGDNYIQLGGLASGYIKASDQYKDVRDYNLALVVGRYLHKVYFDRVGFPVGFHVFAGVHRAYERFEPERESVLSPKDTAQQTTDDTLLTTDVESWLYVGPGFGIDIFNPATKGFGMWMTVSYTANFDVASDYKLEETTFLNSIGASYNW